MEAVRKPRSGVRVEIPADSVRTVGFKSLKRINGVALGLAHLLSVFVLNVTEDDDVFERSFVENQRGNRKQRVEPASCLIDSLGNEVCRELALEKLLVLKGIVVLGKGH